MSINRVYSICQKLYEGIEHNGQKLGLITYMRTDSNTIAPDFVEKIYGFVAARFGEDQVNRDAMTNKSKRKKTLNAQEAHEAIRITDLGLDLQNIIANLNLDEKQIAKKVFIHTIAPFMTRPVLEKTTFTLVNGDCCVYVESFKLMQKGYYTAFEYIQAKYLLPQFIEQLPDSIVIHFTLTDEVTSNHSRYTEGSLIAKMKKLGIGRPSTYSYITNVIKNRSYSVISHGKYYLLSSGFILGMFIELFLSEIINYEFTSDMETSLDKLMRGDITKDELLDRFCTKIDAKLQFIGQTLDRETILHAIQDLVYKQYGDQCRVDNCQNKYTLKFIHSQAKIVCDKHISNLHLFGFKNDNYLKYSYSTKFQRNYNFKNKKSK